MFQIREIYMTVSELEIGCLAACPSLQDKLDLCLECSPAGFVLVDSVVQSCVVLGVVCVTVFYCAVTVLCGFVLCCVAYSVVYSVAYSVVYSVMYSVVYSVAYNVVYSVMYSVAYSVVYSVVRRGDKYIYDIYTIYRVF